MAAKIELKMEFWICIFSDRLLIMSVTQKEKMNIFTIFTKNVMVIKPRKKRKNKFNPVWIFLSIVIAIAIISMLISYFWVEQEKPDVLLLPKTEKDQKAVEPTKEQLELATPLEGTWVSNYDGVMLTVSGLSFTLESSGVDGAQKINGDLSIEENIVTFVYTSGSEVCKGPEGHYLYSIDGSGELFFKLIKDICDGRKERMTASWFRL
jgi:hypothetical protein